MKGNFAKTLKELRLRAGYTQKQVYEKLGIPQSTFSSWEIGKAEPSASMTLKLCEIYHIDDILSAFGYNRYNEGGSLQLTAKETDLIQRYRVLDPSGQSAVDWQLSHEAARAAALDEQSDKMQELEALVSHPAATTRLYAYMRKIACAGTGFYFDDIPTDTIEAPYMEGADFIISVSGNSMEPDYHAGDNLYVKKTDHINYGEVGIFTINNDCFLKEYSKDGLISRNPDHDDTLESEDVRLIGKVIGKMPDGVLE